jgi:hypothetical protein
MKVVDARGIKKIVKVIVEMVGPASVETKFTLSNLAKLEDSVIMATEHLVD